MEKMDFKNSDFCCLLKAIKYCLVPNAGIAIFALFPSCLLFLLSLFFHIVNENKRLKKRGKNGRGGEGENKLAVSFWSSFTARKFEIRF